MTADAWSELADRIGSAAREREKELFHTAVSLLGAGASRQTRGRWQRQIRQGTFNELAVALCHAAFADCGFQFGHTAAGCASKGIASLWRFGDDHASVHHAATPALALLCAVTHEHAKRNDAERLSRCIVCGGLGWFFTTGNRKQICHHERNAA